MHQCAESQARRYRQFSLACYENCVYCQHALTHIAPQVDQSNSASAAAQAPPAEASAASGGASSSYANLMGGKALTHTGDTLYLYGLQCSPRRNDRNLQAIKDFLKCTQNSTSSFRLHLARVR